MTTLALMQLSMIVAMSAFLLGHLFFMTLKSLKSVCKKEGSLFSLIREAIDSTPDIGNNWKNWKKFENKNPFSFSENGIFYTEKQKKLNFRIYFVLGAVLIALLSASSLWYLFLVIFIIFPIITLGILQILGSMLEVVAHLLYKFICKYIPELFLVFFK